MLPLLAQLSVDLAQAGPALQSPLVAVYGVLIVALLTIGVMFAGLRNLRSNLADELKREITAKQEAAKVDVQQPLIVTPQTQFATKTDAEFLKSEITKVDNERRTSVANLHAKVDATNAALRAELTQKIERLEGRIDSVPDRTIKLLRETKDLI